VANFHKPAFQYLTSCDPYPVPRATQCHGFKLKAVLLPLLTAAVPGELVAGNQDYQDETCFNIWNASPPGIVHRI